MADINYQELREKMGVANEEGGLKPGKAISELEEAATKDSLTDIYNKKELEESASREVGLARRSGKPLTVVFFDLDYFKPIDEYHKHIGANPILRGFAQFVSELVRHTDIWGRYGGDEFVLVLPDTDKEGANVILGKIRDSFSDFIKGQPELQELPPGMRQLDYSSGTASLNEVNLGKENSDAEVLDKLIGMSEQEMMKQKEPKREQRY